MTTGRILGIDVGEKRFGLAQSDPLGILASPVGTFSENELLETLVTKSKNEQVSRIIVGWPISMDASENKATAMVDQFIQRLLKKVPGIPVEKLDERFTSVMAHQSIRSSGVPMMKRRNKDRVDAVAASILLQSFLDKKV